MQAHPLVYLMALIVALPVYILWGTGLYIVYRALADWVFMPQPGKMPGQRSVAPPKISARG